MQPWMYNATYQTTVEYEKWYMEVYVLMNPIVSNFNSLY